IAMEKCCCLPGIWISHMKSGILWQHTVAIKPLVRNRSHSKAHCSPFLVAQCEFWHSSIVPLPPNPSPTDKEYIKKYILAWFRKHGILIHLTKFQDEVNPIQSSKCCGGRLVVKVGK